MAARAAARRADQGDWADLTKQQFSSRLRKIMDEKGLSSNEIAERMREHLSDDETFATSNLSHYRQGRSVPRPKYLAALSAALGVSASDLLPGGLQEVVHPETPSISTPVRSRRRTRQRRRGVAGPSSSTRAEAVADIDHSASMIAMEEKGHMVHLRFDQIVTWDVALTILNALKPSDAPR